MSETLYVVTCVSNPLRWQTRETLARAAINDWLRHPNVHVTLVECAYGSRDHNMADMASHRLNHVPVRATTMAWTKENLLNLDIAKLPGHAAKVATLDADVTFRRHTWADDALAALDLYPVIQPWDTAYDLGPHDEHVQTTTVSLRAAPEGAMSDPSVIAARCLAECRLGPFFSLR